MGGPAAAPRAALPRIQGLMLEGKVALVTGAGGGIGRDFALAMAAAGARVLVNDLGTSVKGEGASGGPAQKVVDEIRAAGGTAAASTDSVADWTSANRIVQAALDHFGRIDAVLNNAGILRDRDRRAPERLVLRGARGGAALQDAGVGRVRAHDVHLRAGRQPRPGQLLGGKARHRRTVQVHRAGHGQVPRAFQLHRALRLEPHDRLDPDRDARAAGARGEAEEHGDGEDRAARGGPRLRRGARRQRPDLRRARERALSLLAEPAAALGASGWRLDARDGGGARDARAARGVLSAGALAGRV